MKKVCVIPARLESSRFPRKVLTMLGEKPMLQWLWEAATECAVFDEVTFAIDDPETARLIDSFEGRHEMTSPECLSGTDRLVELKDSGKLQGDIWINWQGDEPFIHTEMIEDLLQTAHEKKFDVYTLKKQIESEEGIEDPNTVKVVTNEEGRALYFSRSPIPCYRDVIDFEETIYFKHIGIYAYTDAALSKISQFVSTPLELAEQLEQLRFLEKGLSLQVHTTRHETLGIDTPEDLAQAIEHIASHLGSIS